MNINSFLNSKTEISSRVIQFKKLSRGLLNKEKRKLEEKLLKPEKIPPYTKNSTKYCSLEDRVIKIIVSKREDLELLKSLFKITYHGGACIADSVKLIEILKNYKVKEGI